MFLKKSSYDEFTTELEIKLQQVKTAPDVEKIARESKAIKNLIAAANLLDEMGLEKQAAEITEIIEKFAWHDPAIDVANDPAVKGLTEEKMLENLKTKGWVFNTDESSVPGPFVVDPSVGYSETNDSADAASSKDGDGEILEVVEPAEGESVSLEPEGDIEIIDHDNDEKNMQTAADKLAAGVSEADVYKSLIRNGISKRHAHWAVQGGVFLNNHK